VTEYPSEERYLGLLRWCYLSRFNYAKMCIISRPY